MSERISWIDTKVSVAKSIGEIYGQLAKLPGYERGGLFIPKNLLDDIECEFVIINNDIPVGCSIKVQPRLVYHRILQLNPHRSRMHRTKIQYEDEIKQQAPAIAARQMFFYIKAMVEIAITGAIDPNEMLLPYMKIAPDGMRVIDYAREHFNPTRALTEGENHKLEVK